MVLLYISLIPCDVTTTHSSYVIYIVVSFGVKLLQDTTCMGPNLGDNVDFFSIFNNQDCLMKDNKP